MKSLAYRWKLIILLFFLLQGIGETTVAQRQFRFSLQDSFQLACTELSSFKAVSGYPGPIRKFGDRFHVYDGMNKHFHAFNLQGKCMDHYEVRCEQGNFHTAMAFDKTRDATYFGWFQTYIRMDGKGGCEWEEFLPYEDDGFQFAQRIYSTPSMRIDTAREKLIFPVKASKADSLPKGSFQVRDAYYQRYDKGGLLAVYPMEDLDGVEGGAPSAFIGDMAEVYKEKRYLPHLDHLHWDLDASSGKIFLGQMGTPKIRVYDQQGELLRSFGQRGEGLMENDSLLTLRDTIARSNSRKSTYRKHQVLSPTYTHLFHDPQRDLLFRVYKAYSEEEKDRLRGLSKSWQNWFSLQVRKPAHLQIYDLKADGKLILDRPVGQGPFRPLGTDGQTLYVNRGCPEAFDNSELKVETYHLGRK